MTARRDTPEGLRRGSFGLRVAIFSLAASILAAPLIWRLTEPAPPPATEGGISLFGLAQRLTLLEAETAALRQRLAEAEQRASLMPDAGGAIPDAALPPTADGGDFGGFEDLMLLSARRDINKDLTPLRIGLLEETFGRPSENLGQDCTAPSELLASLLEVRDVGPFQARLVSPALDSLETIFGRVRDDYPDLHRQLRSYGGFCARLVRGSLDGISRHAFGVALDVSVGGLIDHMGDGKTQLGLIILSDYFFEEGWVWGAGFGREDSMHFEVSQELFERWREQGRL